MVKSLRDRRGKYGMAKVKAFTVLTRKEWTSSRELVVRTGLSYGSLTRLLGRWVSWDYVERRLSLRFGIGTYEYRLAVRGRGWLDAATRDLPNYALFRRELDDWEGRIGPMLPSLMAGSFRDVLSVRDLV